MCSYKSLLPQPCSWYSKTKIRTRQECAATSPYCLSPAVSSHRQKEELDRNVQLQVLIATVQQSVLKERVELDRNVQLQVLIASVLQSVLRDREQNQIGTCSYKSLLLQSYSRFSETERRTRYEFAATSTYCLSPDIGTHRHREELDRNVQLQVLIDSALHSVLRDRDQNQIGMCSYKSLLPQSCSQYSETGSRTRQERAATSPYCLSPEVSTHRRTEELDRNVQLQVLIASVLQLVLTVRQKNQIGMCSYKSLLPQSCSRYSQTERRTRQECAAISTYCLSPAVSSHRHREELDRNVQLQVLIDSALHSVLRERDQNQIGMCSYKSLLPQSRSQHSQTERRTRQECAATSTYCLSPDISTHRDREELDRNVQLQVLIASALQLVLKDREKSQIGMCSYKSLLPQSYSRFSETERRTRYEFAATSTYCLSPDIGTHRQREELDRNVQLQVLIDSALHSVLRDRDQNKIGMCSYKSLLPQSCSQYSETGSRTRQECSATSPYCLSPAVSSHRQKEELDRNVQLQVLIATVQQSVLKERLEQDRNVQLQVLIASVLQSVLRDREQNQIGMCSHKSLLPQT